MTELLNQFCPIAVTLVVAIASKAAVACDKSEKIIFTEMTTDPAAALTTTSSAVANCVSKPRRTGPRSKDETSPVTVRVKDVVDL